MWLPVSAKDPHREHGEAEQHADDNEPGMTPRLRVVYFVVGIKIRAAVGALLGLLVDGLAAVRAIAHVVIAAEFFLVIAVVIAPAAGAPVVVAIGLPV